MTKISQYTSMTTLQSGDLMDISEDLGGSYGSRSLTYSNLLTNLNADLTGVVTLGAANQVPYMNPGATDFVYSANLTFTGSLLTLTATAYLASENELRLGSSTANYNAFKSPAGMGSSLTYTLPAAYPTSTGQVLSSTTTGTMTWANNPTPVIKYVNNEADFLLAFTDFISDGVAGIIKLGGDITLSGNQNLNFSTGIEVWGGTNRIIFGSYVITIQGTKGVMRDVRLTGSLDFNTGVINSQNILKIDSASMTDFRFVSCSFNSVVGDAAFAGTKAYPVIVTNTAASLFLEFDYCQVGTTQSGAGNKPYDSFRIQYVPTTKDAFKVTFKDWICSAPAPTSQSDRWQTAKNAMKILVNGSITGLTKRPFFYDQSVTFDTSSTMALDLFPTFWGPTTKIAAVNPTSSPTFGNPGDLLINGSAIYMKHTGIGSDTNWSQIN
jgi:hypothetical protein